MTEQIDALHESINARLKDRSPEGRAAVRIEAALLRQLHLKRTLNLIDSRLSKLQQHRDEVAGRLADAAALVEDFTSEADAEKLDLDAKLSPVAKELLRGKAVKADG